MPFFHFFSWIAGLKPIYIKIDINEIPNYQQQNELLFNS